MLFLDEVHRFNKAQQVRSFLFRSCRQLTGSQDIFLPYLEQGYIQVSCVISTKVLAFDLTWMQLIGATTENPSFKLTGALLSRCRSVKAHYCILLATLRQSKSICS